MFAALRGVFAHAVAFGLAQLAISLVGIWVAVRAARGSRASLVASGVMHAIYAAVVIGVVASGG